VGGGRIGLHGRNNGHDQDHHNIPTVIIIAARAKKTINAVRPPRRIAVLN
jgi:hypothetical protein